MKKQWIATAVCAFALGIAFAQTPKRVERADDLPRFSYPVQGDLEAIVRDPQKFEVLARLVRRDVESTLAAYDIAELATRRAMLGQLLQLDLLEGKYDDALKRSNEIRALQERPADKLLSGMSTRAMLAGIRKTGNHNSPAYFAEVAAAMRAELDKVPYAQVQNEIKAQKGGFETIGESLALGRVRNQLQPIARQTGALSSDLVGGLIGARFSLEFIVPMKAAMVQALSGYIAANQVDKPDIWKARDVALPAGRSYTPVRVVIWDSGVDMSLYPGRLIDIGGKPAMIAFDRFAMPSASPLEALTPDVQPRMDQLLLRTKGLSDLQSNIDSPEASAVKKLLSELSPDQYKKVIEDLRLTGNYMHGTHVSGIAMTGNPYAQLGVARIEFGHTLLPDPCPTPELQKRIAGRFGDYADFIRKSGARVVNMSWGGNLRSYEVELEQCNIGKDTAERRKVAREYFDLHLNALKAVFESLPEVLFVTSAGNSGDDPTFNDAYPSGIVLPNLVAVGAVDKAGDEASFTSYGKTVLLHANGYQVDSIVPGGRHIALSGTSMASPQVTNLAAKMIAVKPSLKPAEVVEIMRKTADRSEDGRRTLINPAKALAAVGYLP